MKNLKIATFALLALALVSCGDRKADENAEKNVDTLSTAVATGHPDIDTTAVETEANVTTTVKGTVTAVQNGKDGYTATIKDDSGKLFYATISIPNLDDPKQYRAVAVGDVITVKGESWKMEDELHIKAEVLE